jgi:hypothetical protein
VALDMSGPCPPRFDQLAHQLGGFGCKTASPVIDLRAPWHLSNWTLPVLEAGMVAAAGYALVHSVSCWRRRRDPIPISLWVSSVIYLLLLEPTVYFPQQLGIPGQHQVVFVHNVFTVQFMYDRLPLYIVALYPAMITLSYELVRALGLFDRRGTLVGALCVGIVHHCFYEVFDHVGPQLRWWVWALDAKPNRLMVASVPMTSIILFATLGPVFLVLLVRWLLPERGTDKPPLSVAAIGLRIVVAGALMLPVLAIIGAPWTAIVADLAPSTAGPIAVVFLIVVLAGLVAMTADSIRPTNPVTPAEQSAVTYAQIHGWTWIAVFAIFWSVALPDLLRATHGVTSDGTRIGSPAYAGASFLAAAAVLIAVALRKHNEPKLTAPSMAAVQ